MYKLLRTLNDDTINDVSKLSVGDTVKYHEFYPSYTQITATIICITKSELLYVLTETSQLIALRCLKRSEEIW